MDNDTDLVFTITGIDGCSGVDVADGVTITVRDVPDEVSSVCPQGRGYWMNHPEAWPVDELEIGSELIGRDALLAMLRQPVKKDVRLILVHQLVAAKLNVAAGTPAHEAIAAADALLASSSSPNRMAMTQLAGQLDGYNNGSCE